MKKGGSNTVPSFPTPAGGPVSPYNANKASQNGNGTLTQARANAQYDDVKLVGSSVQNGGRHIRDQIQGKNRRH